MPKSIPELLGLKRYLFDYLFSHYRRKLRRMIQKRDLNNQCWNSKYLAVAITDRNRVLALNSPNKNVHLATDFKNEHIVMQHVMLSPDINRYFFANNNSAIMTIFAELANSIRIGEMIKLEEIFNRQHDHETENLHRLLMKCLLSNWLTILQNFPKFDLRKMLEEFTKYLTEHWQTLEPDLKANKNKSLNYLLAFYAKCSAPQNDRRSKLLIAKLYQVSFIYLKDHYTDNIDNSFYYIRNIINPLFTINRNYGNGELLSNEQVTLTLPIDLFSGSILDNDTSLSNGTKIKFVITSKEALGRFIDDLCLNFEKTDSRFDVINKINKIDISFDYQQYAKDVMTYIDLFYQIKQTDYQTIYVILTYLFSDLEKELLIYD